MQVHINEIEKFTTFSSHKYLHFKNNMKHILFFPILWFYINPNVSVIKPLGKISFIL